MLVNVRGKIVVDWRFNSLIMIFSKFQCNLKNLLCRTRDCEIRWAWGRKGQPLIVVWLWTECLHTCHILYLRGILRNETCPQWFQIATSLLLSDSMTNINLILSIWCPKNVDTYLSIYRSLGCSVLNYILIKCTFKHNTITNRNEPNTERTSVGFASSEMAAND